MGEKRLSSSFVPAGERGGCLNAHGDHEGTTKRPTEEAAFHKLANWRPKREKLPTPNASGEAKG